MNEAEQAQLKRVVEVAANAIGALVQLAGSNETLIRVILEHAERGDMQAALQTMLSIAGRVQDKITATTLSDDDVYWLRAAAIEQARLIAYATRNADTAEQIERNITRHDYQRLALDAGATVQLWTAQDSDGTADGSVVDMDAYRAALAAEREWQKPTPAQRYALRLDDVEPPPAS